MNNSVNNKIEKVNSIGKNDNDFEEHKSQSIPDQLESDNNAFDRNTHLVGTNGEDPILNRPSNPAGYESKGNLKCSANSTDSNTSEFTNSFQSPNMQQSQNKDKTYWWDSLGLSTNHGNGNTCLEPNKSFKYMENGEASDNLSCSNHSARDSMKPDGKNSTSAYYYISPSEQKESSSNPNHITQNTVVNLCDNKTITPLSSYEKDSTKNNMSVPKLENLDLNGKTSTNYYEKDHVLPKGSTRPKENYGTVKSVRSRDDNCRNKENKYKYEYAVKNNQTTGSRSQSPESSVTIDHSLSSSCNSQTINYNSKDSSLPPYGSESCTNQGDFSVRPSSKKGRARHGSGSWIGVNESDEELQRLARQNGIEDSTFNSQSLSDSHIFRSQGRQYVNSYQESFNSFASENTVPHCNDFLHEESIKRRLKFFFMNPIDKYRARKKCPWKLLVQIIKVIICTVQLCMFAIQRYNHVSYLWDTKVSLSHLFIQGWDSSREIVSYPPSTGPLAVYDIQQFYDFVDFSVNAFAHIEETAVGAYKYEIDNGKINMPEFCMTSYKMGANETNKKGKLRNSILTQCFRIPDSILNSTENFSLKKFLASKNRSINFDLLLESSYSFNLQTVKLKSEYPFETPECFQLETLIYFDNNDHDGQMLIDLDIVAKVLDCEDNVTVTESVESKPAANPLRTVVNVMTILVCSISFVLCFRALYRAQFLRSAVNSCFLFRFNRPLNKWESFEFVNLWYILICINDIFIIIGSVIKISLESQDYEGYLDKWNVCSLLLGTGNLLIWFGCLRYLGFFKTYNVLILTIKHCIPNITRYSICTMMVFAGYAFCGWLVLGPYHIKFRSLSTTSECLFSLINGDDMFATFTSTIGKDAIVWWFSRVYLYTFISLFIYVILSLVIAIITDAYYTLQKYYTEGFPETDLLRFAAESKADLSNGDFHDTDDSLRDIMRYVCCCCRSNHPCRRRASDYEVIPSNES